MKAAQIDRYAKHFKVVVRDIPVPQLQENEVLIRVKAAAVNPLDILIATGSVRLIQNYDLPLTLGNECSGIIEKVGSGVSDFAVGDAVYTRLPLNKIGTFATYVAADHKAVAKMPAGYDFTTAAAIPLAALTAYQGLTEELEVQPGRTLLITGVSGSFGQVAVPIARAMGLHVTATGNARSRKKFEDMGVSPYLDYRKEHYWELLPPVDYVLDTLGASEFAHGLSVLKKGGTLLSLRTGPNRWFARKNGFSKPKQLLFALAGFRYDRAAQKQGKRYRFMFVRADGAQLQKITEIITSYPIHPDIDAPIFSLDQVSEALERMSRGKLEGKVIIKI